MNSSVDFFHEMFRVRGFFRGFVREFLRGFSREILKQMCEFFREFFREFSVDFFNVSTQCKTNPRENPRGFSLDSFGRFGMFSAAVSGRASSALIPTGPPTNLPTIEPLGVLLRAHSGRLRYTMISIRNSSSSLP